MSTSAAALKTGDILNIRQQIKNEVQDRIWLVLFVEANLTKGYQLFKCICLDEEINITDEYGTTKEIIPVKFKKRLDIILNLCYIIIRTKSINDIGGKTNAEHCTHGRYESACWRLEA